MVTKPPDIKVGDIIYPRFDEMWRFNQRLGRPAWEAIRVKYDKDKDRFFTRVARGSDASTPHSDQRMAGKWQYFSIWRHGRGLVVFIENAREFIVKEDPKIDEDCPAHLKETDPSSVYVLPTHPKILGLEVTRVFKSSVSAKVVEIELP